MAQTVARSTMTAPEFSTAVLILGAAISACGPGTTPGDSASGTTGSGDDVGGSYHSEASTSVEECSVVYEGLLTIDQSTDVVGLEQVGVVNGGLVVKGTSWPDLSFLGCVREVHGSVSIVDNTEIVSLAGLDRLETIAVAGEPASLFVWNPKLESLGGLGPIKALDRLVLGDNPVLEDLALRELESVEWLEVGGCVDDVQSIDGSLMEINGLSSLRSLNGVFIGGQRDLVSLGRLHEIPVSGWHGLGIVALHNNPSLPYAEIDALAQVTEQAGKLTSGCGGDDYPIPICPRCPEH